MPLMKGKTPDDWRKSFYYHYYEFPGPHNVAKHCGVRTAHHKLIHYYRLNEWEFFDLEKDPHEMNSVYGDPEYAKLVADHKKELASLQKRLDETEPHRPVPGDPETRRKKRGKKGR